MLKKLTIATLLLCLLLLTTSGASFGSWTSWFSQSPEPAPLLTQPVPVPGTTGFQVVPAQIVKPFSLSFDAQPIFTRESINFHNDQWTTNISKTRMEFSTSTTLLDWLRVKYSIMPGITILDSFMPTNLLKINQAEWGASGSSSNGSSGSGVTPKPIALDWSEKPSHRLTLTGLVNFPLRPCAVLEYPSFTITGTTEKDGKTITDSETFNKLLYGVGGSLDYNVGKSKIEVLFVGSQNYLLGEGRYSCPLFLGLSGFVGGFWKQMTFDELRIRSYGPMAGASISF